MIKLRVMINRNQDPKLFELFTRAKGNREELTKELLRKAIKKIKRFPSLLPAAPD